MASPGSTLLLIADDYALTEGVTQGILALAEAGRLSGTSAMVTTRHWSAHAPALARLRPRLALGLHLNLTLGAPLGPMPSLAPDGRLPPIGEVAKAALSSRIDTAEIAAETRRQLDRFEAVLGMPPDFLDGHQHVHALPRVRDGVLAALQAYDPARRILVRDPADTIRGILARKTAIGKALTLRALAAGFGARVRATAFPMNTSFAGVTDFDAGSTATDLARAMTSPGRLHLVMCHPGFPDDELASLDPVLERRRNEYEILMREDGPAAGIWRPDRARDGNPIDWRTLCSPSSRASG